MSFDTLRRWAYRCSALLALSYVAYVLVLKAVQRAAGGPLGEVGEFLLVLACVTAFCVGLFADEAARATPKPSSSTPDKETPA